VTIEGVEGAATAGYKTADSVVIRDTSAPVTGVGANCTKVDAHDMRCTSPFGAQRVFLDYTAGDGWDAVDIPVASAPFSLDAKLGPGWDYLTVYGPVGVTATTGPGDDYVKLDATGTNATTPPGGTIDTGYGWDQLFIANGHREDPICGPDFDTLKSDPGENDPSCESVEHPSPQY
jgi:hypothetical protein